MGYFTGPMHSSIHQALTAVPNDMDALWDVELRQPLVELQSLAALDDDPSISWSAAAQMYDQSELMYPSDDGFHIE
jgi:hypothetical protein